MCASWGLGGTATWDERGLSADGYGSADRGVQGVPPQLDTEPESAGGVPVSASGISRGQGGGGTSTWSAPPACLLSQEHLLAGGHQCSALPMHCHW